MKKWMIWLLGGLLIVASSLLVLGFSTRQHTEWGPPASVGQGQVQTFVKLNESGNPEAVGVYFTAKLLSGLPAKPSMTVLQFPDSIKATPLNHFMLDWNPEGHEPPGVYTVPHFDFHFYNITPQERAKIMPGSCTSDQDSRIPNPPGSAPVTCEVFDQAMQNLPTDMLPPDYTLLPAVAPHMGNHLIDLTGPEFNGQPFTHTWIYGAYGGKIIFLEPMITKAFLETQANVCQAIKTPEAMPEAGWYPTEYCIRYLSQQDAYTVSLESFKWFAASDGQIGQ